MRKLLMFALSLLLTTNVYAGTVTQFKVYTTGSEVNAANLNGNYQNIITTVNAGLDNDNADISKGFRFYEVLGSTPSAGTNGRAVYNTANDELLIDNASSFLPIANGSLNNLSSVAVNTTIVSDTDNADDLGSSSVGWASVFLSDSGSAATSNGEISYNSNKFNFYENGSLSYPTAFKAGSFTRDISTATGSQSVTGVGFTPTNVIFCWVIDASGNFGYGVDDLSTQISNSSQGDTNPLQFSQDANDSIKFALTAANTYSGDLASFDSNGFTIDWVKGGSPSGTGKIIYFAFK